MSNLLGRRRRAAAISQGFLCRYCRLPMWEWDPQSFASRYGLSLQQAMLLRCTAEHLRARQEGEGEAVPISPRLVCIAMCCGTGRGPRCRPRPTPPMCSEGWLAAAGSPAACWASCVSLCRWCAELKAGGSCVQAQGGPIPCLGRRACVPPALRERPACRTGVARSASRHPPRPTPGHPAFDAWALGCWLGLV